MEQALIFIVDMFYEFFDFLAGIVFSVNGFTVSYLALIVATMIITMVIAVFWRGAKV